MRPVQGFRCNADGRSVHSTCCRSSPRVFGQFPPLRALRPGAFAVVDKAYFSGDGEVCDEGLGRLTHVFIAGRGRGNQGGAILADTSVASMWNTRLVLVFRGSVSAAAFIGVTLVTPATDAEELLVHGILGLGTGLEGSDALGAQAWRRARSRIVAGVDLRSDEGRSQGPSFRGFAEVEGHASLGGEVRWTAWPSRGVGLFGGGAFVLAPRSLVGAGAGLEIVIPLGKTAGFLLEPAVMAFPFGGDLPEKTVLVWGALTLGLRIGI